MTFDLPGAGSATDTDTDRDGDGDLVFLDADTVILETRVGRRGPELNLRGDVPAGLDRLRQVADHLIVLVEPARGRGPTTVADVERVEFLRAGLGEQATDLIVSTCPHDAAEACACPKPGQGLIDLALETHGLGARRGWHIGGDQSGVMAGRGAGLRTIRIGPTADDPMSGIHRPDHQARDLLDAANHILMYSLTSSPATSSG